jgi:hypothetical protein
MGVCLLGNYETIEPEFSMLESLEGLLSWKAFKDKLNPLESNFHPLNSNLGVIAGHRDGCSTACPGENVYQLLSEIRLNVDEQLSVCDGESEEEESPVVELEIDSILNQTIYPNPIKNNLSFSLKISQSDQKDLRYIRIFNQEGKSIIWENLYFSENKIEVKLPNSLKSGIYLLQMSFNEGGDKSQRFIIQ